MEYIFITYQNKDDVSDKRLIACGAGFDIEIPTYKYESISNNQLIFPLDSQAEKKCGEKWLVYNDQKEGNTARMINNEVNPNRISDLFPSTYKMLNLNNFISEFFNNSE